MYGGGEENVLADGLKNANFLFKKLPVPCFLYSKVMQDFLEKCEEITKKDNLAAGLTPKFYPLKLFWTSTQIVILSFINFKKCTGNPG